MPSTAWLKPSSLSLSLSMSLSMSPDVPSLSIESLPTELCGEPLVILQSAPRVTGVDPRLVGARREYGFYGLEHNGALRPGGQVPLLSRRHVGLLLNYAGIGLVYGGVNSAVLPFLLNYAQLERYKIHAAYTCVNMIWSFKAFGGLLTDSLRVCGYRRKPYLIAGWTLCCVCLLYLGMSPMPSVVEAQNHAWLYVLLMALATVGYFLANVAADALVVQLAQREPLISRGHTQVCVYAVRAVALFIADLFVAAALNGPDYGGSFSWSLDLSQLMLILGLCALVPLGGSIWLLHEDRQDKAITAYSSTGNIFGNTLQPEPEPGLIQQRIPVAQCREIEQTPTEGLDPAWNFSDRCHHIWLLLQSRAMWQVLAFELTATFCQSVDSTARATVAANWAHVERFSQAISLLIWGLTFTAGLLLTQRFLLRGSWGRLFCLSTVWVVGVDVVTVLCSVFNIVREQYFWLYMQTLAAPAAALRFLIFSFPIVELAPRGLEGTTYGLVITFHNMAIPLGMTFYKAIDSYFSISDDAVHADANVTRVQVLYTYLIAWAMQLVSLAFVGLLPRQKLEVQQLRYYGGYSPCAGWLVLVVLLVVLIYTTTANVLSLFESTACLRIAGGSGCDG